MNTRTEIITKEWKTGNARKTTREVHTTITTRIVRLNDGVMRVKHKAPKRKEFVLRITQHEPEWCTNPLNNDFEYEDVIVIGNSGCSARNNSRYADLFDRIIDRVITGDMDYMVLNYDRNGYKNVSEVIEDYLWVKPNKWQTGKVKKYLEMRYGTPNTYYHDEDLIADLMTLFTPHEWATRSIKGCVQREWAEVVYPADIYGDKFIDEFEAFYFGLYWEYEAEYRGESVWYTFCGFEDEDRIINEISADYGTKNVEYHSYY